MSKTIKKISTEKRENASKTKAESPALTLLRFTYENASTSRRRIGYALCNAMEATIEAGMRFDPDDLVTASKNRYEGGFGLSSYLNQDVGEDWYTKAVKAGHATAMTAIERFLRRPRFVYQSEVIHLGRGYDADGERGGTRIRLAEAITEDNQGGWVYASSFSDDGKFVNFMASNCRPLVKCHVCGEYSRKTEEEKIANIAGHSTPKARRRTYRMAWKTLNERERARVAVQDRFYEATSADYEAPSLREYTGRVLLASVQGALLDLAKLKLGEEIALTPGGDDATPVVVKRIAYVCHDELKRCEKAGEDGCHVTNWHYERSEWNRFARMLEDGLVTVNESHYTDREHVCYYVLTDVGRERLYRLSGAREVAEMNARTQARQRQAEAVVCERVEEIRTEPARRAAREAARAETIARLKAEYTEEELATVVTRADSLAEDGNCATGTDNWIARHGGRTEMTVRELLELDGGENEFNVRWIIRRGLERARCVVPQQ